MKDEAMITFDFEGRHYKVDMSVYEKELIKLPDGRILLVSGWLETMPPKPRGLSILQLAEAKEV